MNRRQQLLLIINPIAGTHSKEGLADTIVRGLENGGFDVDVCCTTGVGDATRLAARAVEKGYDGVVACGGDGTVNETARALTGTPVPLGIIPAGSGNGLARHLNIPLEIPKAVDIITERNIRDCDYGEVNGHPFFCTFGLGFDAAVSDRFAHADTRGKMTYIRSALQEFLHYQPQTYTIIADGEEIVVDAMLIAVCNANQYGNNAFIAPDASITDGLLDLVIALKMPKANVVVTGMKMMAGTLSENSRIITRKVKDVTIKRPDAGPAHLDGEPFSEAGTEIAISCKPGGLRLFTNAAKKPFRPIITPFMATVSDVETSIKHIFKQ